MAVTVPNAGDILVELDTGAIIDGFELDDAIRGVLNNPDFVLDGTTEFADITTYVRSLSIRRGRERTTDQANQSGTLTFTMQEDAAQELNPLNDLSIYYNQAAGMPGLAPLRQVRVSRDGEYLIQTYVTNYDYSYNLGALDTVSVAAADATYLLARTALAEQTPSVQTSSARVSAVLAFPEVNYTGATDIAADPVATLGAYQINNATPVMDYLAQISNAEQGRIFISRDGVLTFQKRISAAFSSPSIQFGDAVNTPYNALTIEFDASDVVNRASITIQGGTTQVATDAASQAAYFIQSVEQSASLLSTDAQALTLADYLLVAEPSPRYTSIGTWFGSLSEPQRDALATAEIGDLIEITKTEPFGAVTQELYIEGIEHTITFDYGMTSKFFTSPTTLVYDFILNDPVFGILDITDPQPALS